MEVDLAFLDRKPLAFELVGDVRGGDGSEQLAFFANARREREGDLGEFVGDFLGLGATRIFGGIEALLLLLDALLVAGRGGVGQPARQEVVPAKAGGDIDDVPGVAEVLDGSLDDVEVRTGPEATP